MNQETTKNIVWISVQLLILLISIAALIQISHLHEIIPFAINASCVVYFVVYFIWSVHTIYHKWKEDREWKKAWEHNDGE